MEHLGHRVPEVALPDQTRLLGGHQVGDESVAVGGDERGQAGPPVLAGALDDAIGIEEYGGEHAAHPVIRANPDDPLTGSVGMRLPNGNVNICGHLPAKSNRKRQVRRMTLSRRKFLAFGSAAAAAGLTGCGSRSSLGGSDELSMWTWVGSVNDGLIGQAEKAIPGYDGMKLAMTRIGTNYKTKVLTSLAGKSLVPDIVAINDDVATYFPNQDQFVDLNDARRQRAREGLPALEVEARDHPRGPDDGLPDGHRTDRAVLPDGHLPEGRHRHRPGRGRGAGARLGQLHRAREEAQGRPCPARPSRTTSPVSSATHWPSSPSAT